MHTAQKFEKKPLPFEDDDTLTSQPALIQRAIAMHLLREGHFDVASTFISEINAESAAAAQKLRDPNAIDTALFHTPSNLAHQHIAGDLASHQALRAAWDADFAPSAQKSADLQQQFAEMYHILHEMRNNRNLSPAIEWARIHSARLEARGSNLEYDLCRLQFIIIATNTHAGSLAAIAYARETFPRFSARYAAQTYALLGSMAYSSNLSTSPYASLFSTSGSSSPSEIVSAAATAFTSEFCALLKLSSASPLFLAVTAGCAALPTLQKFSQIKSTARISWTTAGELPVEIPLPPAYHFHSVFVCPVSKEQSTDTNPPMMMPCGHVIAKESLDKISKGNRFKCPYCPAESFPVDAMVIYL